VRTKVKLTCETVKIQSFSQTVYYDKCALPHTTVCKNTLVYDVACNMTISVNLQNAGR